MGEKCIKETGMTLARELRVRTVVPHIDVFSNDMKKQLALLDDDELAVLDSIKEKLNTGISDELAKAASTVGVIVW